MEGQEMPAARHDDALFGDVASLIDGARARAAVAVNSELVMLYWSVGKRVREDVLGGERGAYGERVVTRLAVRLNASYGRGWSKPNLLKMLKLATDYPDERIVSTLSRQLSWSHFIELFAILEQPKRDFYAAFAVHERWSVRTLRGR
ncbi:MAG: DUF1016 N-terminal domain-containing protein, partial [Coriobacteriia bacterium]